MKTLHLGIIAVLILAGTCNAVFGTSQTCEKTILPHNWPSSHIYVTDASGNLPYFPLTGHTAIFHDDDEWNTSSQPRTIHVTLTIKDQYTGQQVFNQTQSLHMQPCSGPESVEWRFVPTLISDYIATVSDDRGNVSMSFRSVPDLPLEQVRSGVDSHNVMCRQDLQLVIKAEDGSPACVHPSTIPKLMVRGWLSTTSLDKNNIISGDFYPGIENDSGSASIKNQTYYIMTLSDLINPAKTIQFHDVVFSFPYGWLVTPGGGLLPVAMTFPDGLTESFGYDKRNPAGSGAMSGLGLGPGPSSNRTVTIFSNHIGPKAGVTLTEDKVKLLVSSDTISSNSSRPVNATLPASFMPCDTPFSQSNNGITVLYMPVNSIGKICVRYSNPNESKNASLTIFDASSHQTAKSITSWAEPSMIPTGNSTVRFSVKTGNQTGFYGLQIFCSGMPFAVGYDAKSNFTLNDFPWEKSPTIYCPMMTYQYKIDSLSGIGVGYIPHP